MARARHGVQQAFRIAAQKPADGLLVPARLLPDGIIGLGISRINVLVFVYHADLSLCPAW